MAIIFPTSPVVGQVFASGGRSWIWNGSAWDSPRTDNLQNIPSLVGGNTFTGNQNTNASFSSTSTDSNARFIATNTAGGSADYLYLLSGINNTGTKAVHFVNSSTRTADGGANAYTIRNDGGLLVLGNSSFTTVVNGVTRTPNQPAFSAYSNVSNIAATQTVPYNVVVLNRGNHYNASNYRFTAPVAGVYSFNIYSIGSTSTTTRFRLFRNSTDLMATGEAHQLRANFTADFTSATASWLVNANANDFFYVQIYAGTDYGTIEYSHFMGYLVG
jgi:hypothetical protein